MKVNTNIKTVHLILDWNFHPSVDTPGPPLVFHHVHCAWWSELWYGKASLENLLWSTWPESHRDAVCVCIGGGKYLMLHFLFIFPPWLVQVYVLLIASNKKCNVYFTLISLLGGSNILVIFKTACISYWCLICVLVGIYKISAKRQQNGFWVVLQNSAVNTKQCTICQDV